MHFTLIICFFWLKHWQTKSFCFFSVQTDAHYTTAEPTTRQTTTTPTSPRSPRRFMLFRLTRSEGLLICFFAFSHIKNKLMPDGWVGAKKKWKKKYLKKKLLIVLPVQRHKKSNPLLSTFSANHDNKSLRWPHWQLRFNCFITFWKSQFFC